MKSALALSPLLVLLGTPGVAAAGQLPVDLPRTCYAADASALQACVTRVRETDAGRDAIDNIKITSVIACSTGLDCLIDLSGLDNAYRWVTIYGESNVATGFSRAGGFSTPVVRVQDTRKVIIRDLFVDDGAAVVEADDTPVAVIRSQDVLIDSVRILGAKFAAIGIRTAVNLVVRNSTVENAQTFGIWMDSKDLSSGVLIENNVIRGAWANGIRYASTDGWITGNQFYGNHAKTVFNHSGGQLLIEAGSASVRVERNLIADSWIEGGRAASGIEFATTAYPDVRITQNTIRNHDGFGIAFNHGTHDLSGVVVHNNNFQSNANGPVDYQAAVAPTVVRNCTGTDTSCLSAKPTGSFLDTAQACRAQDDACTIQVRWSSSNAISPSVRVFVPHSLFSSNPSGDVSVPWITRPGGYFELYSGAVLLGTRWMIAVP